MRFHESGGELTNLLFINMKFVRKRELLINTTTATAAATTTTSNTNTNNNN